MADGSVTECAYGSDGECALSGGAQSSISSHLVNMQAKSIDASV